jgi:hypothetical protein
MPYICHIFNCIRANYARLEACQVLTVATLVRALPASVGKWYETMERKHHVACIPRRRNEVV